MDKENNNNSNNAKAKANRNKTNNSTNDIKTTNNNHKTTNSNKNDNVPSSHLDSDSDEDLFKELEYVPKKVERTTNPKPMPTQMANANPLAIKSQPPPSPLSDITPNRPTTKKRT
uniref:Uncharacterized protein n=1 Tax=Arcella intermedia TaxID=1963864 RepID=A0A6B2LR08_9EUKA